MASTLSSSLSDSPHRLGKTRIRSCRRCSDVTGLCGGDLYRPGSSRPDLPFDRISDVFRCKKSTDFGYPFLPVHSVAIEGPAIILKQNCCSDTHVPHFEASRNPHLPFEQPMYDGETWAAIQLEFKGTSFDAYDLDSAMGKAFAGFRVELLCHVAIDEVYLVSYHGESTKCSLFLKWKSSDKDEDSEPDTELLLSMGIVIEPSEDEVDGFPDIDPKIYDPEKLFSLPNVVECRSKLEPHLKVGMKYSLGVPFYPLWNPFVPGAQRAEIIDFVHLGTVTDADRAKFQLRLQHFTELMLRDPYRMQPVTPQLDGWVDQNDDTCGYGDRLVKSNTFRAVFWWNGADEEAAWTKLFMQDDFAVTGHRALYLARTFSHKFTSQHVTVEKQQLYALGRGDIIFGTD